MLFSLHSINFMDFIFYYEISCLGHLHFKGKAKVEIVKKFHQKEEKEQQQYLKLLYLLRHLLQHFHFILLHLKRRDCGTSTPGAGRHQVLMALGSQWALVDTEHSD